MFHSLSRFSGWLGALPARAKYLVCLISGLTGGALALAPVSQPVFFFAGFILFADILRGSATRKQAFFFSWLYALGFHVTGLYWISASLFIDIARYAWVLPFSLLALPCYLALLFGIAAAACHSLRTAPVAHAGALAASIFLSEIVRSTLMTGFPWNLFGYIWTENTPLLQSTSLFGITGLTLLTLLAASSLSLILQPPKKTALAFIACSWGLLSVLTLWGTLRLDTTETSFHDNLRLRLVQPAITQHQRRNSEQRKIAFADTIALSVKATGSTPTHIIWAETASPYFLIVDEAARKQMAPIIPREGALLTGAPSRDETHFYNSLVVVDHKAAIRGIYDKARLVPFGEFIPLRAFLKTIPVAADVIGAADFSRGMGPKTLRAPGLPPFAPMICYEAIFSGAIIDKSDPPEWLLQITNDAWFGDTSGPYQHFAMARVRAIEEGLPLIRVANSGISAAVDPLGRTLHALPLDARDVLDVTLPKALTDKTWFSKSGNTPVFILAFLLLGICCMPRLQKKK